ncbi:hypothetical protein [Aeromonas jandaei]|uniref:hypothetical protein n=1 Tax=Aeromonas jandaei TaxID=650 RepID=UPI003672CBF6
MQTSQSPVTKALSRAALLFAINATLLTLIPGTIVSGLGEISYLRRPDLATLIWGILLLYPCLMALPVIRAIQLWQRLRPKNNQKDEPSGSGLIIATAQLTQLRYWGRLLMIANLLYLPFLLTGLFTQAA